MMLVTLNFGVSKIMFKTVVSASALLIIWSFSISIAVRLQETQSHVFIIANWKRALDKVFFSRYPHLSFIWMATSDIIIKFDEGHSGSHI
jgi:hypothetical protein